MIAHFIVYVRDQRISAGFYKKALDQGPTLDVPGMTEFTLSANCILGLMPEKGIKRLLGHDLPDPEQARGIPRAELYLQVEDPRSCFERAVNAGAKPLSGVEIRSWGHEAGYLLDPDGHVLAFARPVSMKPPS